jgi:hypothetical protein
MGKVIIMLSYESTSFLLTLLWVLNAAGYKKCLVVFFLGTEPAVERKRNKRRFKHPQMMVRKGLIHKCSLFSIFSKCGTI